MIDHIAAHAYSSSHRVQLLHDQVCGCFYCLRVFARSMSPTPAALPSAPIYCGAGAVIGGSSGFPITRTFPEKMRTYWF